VVRELATGTEDPVFKIASVLDSSKTLMFTHAAGDGYPASEVRKVKVVRPHLSYTIAADSPHWLIDNISLQMSL